MFSEEEGGRPVGTQAPQQLCLKLGAYLGGCPERAVMNKFLNRLLGCCLVDRKRRIAKRSIEHSL